MAVCRQRRAQGRPAKRLPPLMELHWDVDANGGQHAPASGRDSTQQAYYKLDCGVCITKIQTKTAVKQGSTAFRCSRHGSSGRGCSALQRAAVEMVERMVGPGSCSVEQYRLLEVAQKPVDIVVEPLDLMVETDGVVAPLAL